MPTWHDCGQPRRRRRPAVPSHSETAPRADPAITFESVARAGENAQGVIDLRLQAPGLQKHRRAWP